MDGWMISILSVHTLINKTSTKMATTAAPSIPSSKDRMGERFRPRLQQMTTTSDSIQGLSLWLLHNKNDAEAAVTVWNDELLRGELDGAIWLSCVTHLKFIKIQKHHQLIN